MNESATCSFRIDQPRQLLAASGEIERLASQVAGRVIRSDLAAPGFAAIDLGTDLSPDEFAVLLQQLAAALDVLYRRRTGRSFTVVHQGKFDQQRSTMPHRDGGPDRSILLLGYEPTAVESQFFLIDYTRCAGEQELHPREYLRQYNPMNDARPDPCLERQTHRIEPFPAGHYRVLLINNSNLASTEPHEGMLGVLHHAIITRPDPTRCAAPRCG